MIGALTLDQLRVLVAIAETGSFSAAARRLGRVQSAISQSVRGLEATQGVMLFDRGAHRPVLTQPGAVLVAQARMVLAGAERFEALAAGVRGGVEPELTLAIDPLVPTAPLIDSLRALGEAFPDLPVRFSTEGVGGAERRLRDGAASIVLGLFLPEPPVDIVAYRLLSLDLVAVAASGHPLARLDRALALADLEPHTQLVLSDPVRAASREYGPEHGPEYGPEYGVVSARRWRFVELSRRLDFLLAGFGWCKMPAHVVAPHLATGRLVALRIADESVVPATPLAIHAAHLRARPPGRAGSWLLDDLRRRLVENHSQPNVALPR